MRTAECCKTARRMLFETGHGFAIGRIPETPECFAVWSFTETAYGRDCYRESRFTDIGEAEKAYQTRAEHYRGMYGIKEKTGHSTAKYYRYYSTQRPVDSGTYPKPDGNEPVVIVNYDCDRRRPVAGGKISAWGELTYRKPLTEKQAEDYELVPAPDVWKIPETIKLKEVTENYG